MVQRGGTVRMNVQNGYLFVLTLVMVACVLFKTCVNGESFTGQGNNGRSVAAVAAVVMVKVMVLEMP